MKKVFLLGNPRSGTSLLRLMLNAHPNIVAPPECGFLHWWNSKYGDWRWKSQIRLNDFLEDLSKSKKIETWKLNYGRLKDYLNFHKPDSYSELIQLVYSYYAYQSKKSANIIVDKNNYYINHLEEIKSVWPDAIYIFLIRDGRDVACSYIDIQNLETSSVYKPKLPVNIADIALEWNNNNLRILNFISKESSFILIKYENLVLNTKEELISLCDFLNIKFDPSMMNYYESEYYDEPIQTLDWKKKTLGPPDKNNVGKFRTILSEVQVKEFNDIAKGALTHFNYK